MLYMQQAIYDHPQTVCLVILSLEHAIVKMIYLAMWMGGQLLPLNFFAYAVPFLTLLEIS